MPKTTFTVPQVPGSKRASERPYTHAVIGRRDSRCSAVTYAADLAANERKHQRWDGKLWDDEKRASEATVGQLYRNHNNFMVEASARVVEVAIKFIGENPDRQAYIDRMSAERQAHLEELKAGTAGELVVLQWSMSQANALKSTGTWCNHHSDVSVVPCVPAGANRA